MDEFARKQELEFSRLMDKDTKELLRLIDVARRELYAEIASLEGLQAERINELIRQIDQIERNLNRDITAFGPIDTRTAPLSVGHVAQNFQALDIHISVGLDTVHSGILRQIATVNLNKIKGVTADTMNTVRSVLFTKMGVKGENPRRIAEYLAGQEGQFAGQYGRLENIVRTTMSTVYNGQKLNVFEYAVAQGISINKKVVETIDYKRNHPISLVLNGKIQGVDKPYRAKVSDVAAASLKLHRGRDPKRGVLWVQQGDYFVGNNLPAHYHERGVIVASKEAVNSD